MPLPPLDLDTRTFADLVDEARALIPRYAPQWTDHNASDPGITLLELFAWLVEQDIYRVNRVPERHRRAFVALTGTVCLPPRPATTILQVTPGAGGDGLVLPAGLTFRAGDLPYRLTAPLTLTSSRLSRIQVFDGSAFADVTARWREGTGFAAFGDDPRPGAALYLGFDAPLPIGRDTSLYVVVGGGRSGPEERARIDAEEELRQRACDAPTLVACGDDVAVEVGPTIADTTRVRRPSLQWSLWDGTHWRVLERPGDIVVDDTRWLTLDGALRLRPSFDAVASVVGVMGDPHVWLRGEPVADRFEGAPVLLDVAVNAVEATQRAPVDESVAHGTGGPRQRVQLGRAPVADGVIAASTVEPDGLHAWAPIATLDAAGPHDRVFTIEAQTGTLAFGDGRRGRPLPEGIELRASYEATLAADGAMAVGTTLALAADPLNATLLGRDPVVTATLIDSIVARRGGSAGVDAEELAHAAGRAAAALWSHERLLQLTQDAGTDTLDQLARTDVMALVAPRRAASLLDFERIALEVPGVTIERARAFGGLDGRLPSLRAPGTVTVVIVAGLPRACPTPSPALLDEVASALARRKTLGTRLIVVGPRYVEVTVAATLHGRRGADPARVEADALRRLRQHIDPRHGGPAGRGWPFGRDVHRTEILALLDAVPGVDAVGALTLTGPDGATCINVCIGPIGIAVSGTHTVDVMA
ncbi:MAG: baseplate J/gp47 family protein [Ilumatobacteraceae bacterium]